MLGSPRSSLVSYNPSFLVSDWDLATPIMQEMVDAADVVPGLDNFGWSRAGDRLILRNAFNDVDTMLTSFDTMTPYIDRLLAGPATLDRFDISAPEEDLARIQARTERDMARFSAKPILYAQDQEPQRGYFRKGPLGKGEKTCTVSPTYTINDWTLARPIMQQIIDQANAQPGCTYFGWEKSGNVLSSRETFRGGDALRFHLESVKPLIDKLKLGPAKLVNFEMHGPAIEVEKAKDVAASLNPIYYESSLKQINVNPASV